MWSNIVIEEIGLKDLLIKAIQDYGFSLETFQITTGISREDLQKIYTGEAVQIEELQVFHLLGILMHLIDTLPIDDNYVIEMIEMLNTTFKISNHAICNIINMEQIKLETYILNPNRLSKDEKNEITKGVLHTCAAITKTPRAFPDEEVT